MSEESKKIENNTDNTSSNDTDQTAKATAPDAPESSTSDFTNNPDVTAYIELKVQEGIQKALQGNVPKASTVKPTEQERKNFEKMTYRERLKLFNSNPQAYNKLAKGGI